MGKRWIVLLMVVALLVIGAVTMGAALAHPGTNDDSFMSSFASRVAGILGLDEAQVQDVVDQARRELRDEVVESKLNTWVEEGRITQEQADAKLEWYKSRPDGFLGFGLGRGRHHGFKHGMRGFDRGGPPPKALQALKARRSSILAGRATARPARMETNRGIFEFPYN